MVMVVPVHAAFDLDTTETFDDGLGDWSTNGTVSLVTESGGNNYAKLADIGGDTDNWIMHQFHTNVAGEYALNFDYRFKGVDTSSSDDNATIGITFTDKIFNTFSSAADLDNTDEWRHVIAPPPSVYLDGNTNYWVYFRLDEALIPGDESTLMTTLHLDNINLHRVVPTPGALVLGAIGISLVGFLRRRNAL